MFFATRTTIDHSVKCVLPRIFPTHKISVKPYYQLERQGHYQLAGPKFSSLATQADFERFKGCEAKIRTHHLLDGRKNFTGALMGMSEGNVRLKVDNKVVVIPFAEVQKARLINFNGEYSCL